jgi:hypothetical protein
MVTPNYAREAMGTPLFLCVSVHVGSLHHYSSKPKLTLSHVAHDSYAISLVNPARTQEINLTAQMTLGVRGLQAQSHMEDGELHFCHTSCVCTCIHFSTQAHPPCTNMSAIRAYSMVDWCSPTYKPSSPSWTPTPTKSSRSSSPTPKTFLLASGIPYSSNLA